MVAFHSCVGGIASPTSSRLGLALLYVFIYTYEWIIRILLLVQTVRSQTQGAERGAALRTHA